ncbi:MULTISPECIES: ATP-binding protein [Cryobacterium]|uniref:ATP-binding protein n=1 Tax=Cryobacterium TaxID=69578 RepID=UPI001F540739|nr:MULTISPECIES: ATP-binding protein [Cryobacterium]
MNKYAAFSLLVIDEWLPDEPDESTESMLLEFLERRYDQVSMVFRTQYSERDWHQRLGSRVHADAIMDRIVHNTIWAEPTATTFENAPPARSRHWHPCGRAHAGPGRARLRGAQRQYRWPPKAIFAGPQTRKYSYARGGRCLDVCAKKFIHVML